MHGRSTLPWLGNLLLGEALSVMLSCMRRTLVHERMDRLYGALCSKCSTCSNGMGYFPK